MTARFRKEKLNGFSGNETRKTSEFIQVVNLDISQTLTPLLNGEVDHTTTLLSDGNLILIEVSIGYNKVDVLTAAVELYNPGL